MSILTENGEPLGRKLKCELCGEIIDVYEVPYGFLDRFVCGACHVPVEK